VPRISDFGLAKELDAADTTFQTRTGEIVGTPSYMAPEQAEGKVRKVGPATDVYGLGAILYELLTGRPPFKGETTLDTLEQVRTQEPVPPPRLQPRLPRDLSTICLKALAKEPARRYATAKELADDLEHFLEGKPICARPVGPTEALWRWCRRNPAVAALSLAAGLFLAVGFGLSTYFAVQESARACEAGENARKADRARADAQRESALLALERGRHLAQQGEGGRGLLWLVRSLERATEAADPDLPRVIRTNIAAVSRRLHTLRQVLQGRSPAVRCVFTPNGTKVWVCGFARNELRLWDLATGRPERELPVEDEVLALAVSPDGTLLLSGCRHQSQLWDTRSCRPHGPPLQHSSEPRIAAFRPDGQVVATGHNDGSVKLWDAVDGHLRVELRSSKHPILGVAFSPDGKTLATGSVDDILQLWDAATAKPIGKPFPHRGQVYALTWAPNSQGIVTGAANGTVQFWDIATGQLRRSLTHPTTVFAVAFSPEGRTLATGCGDRAARLWDAATGQLVGNLLPHQGAVQSVGLSPDGKVVATAGEDGLVRLWDVAPSQVALPHRTWVYAGTFSPDGHTALTGSGDSRALLWDVSSGKPLGPPLEHPDGVRAVAFRPDGQGLFTGCGNGQLWRWELSPKRTGTKIDAHRGAILSLAISPDGRTLVTGSEDGSARLWDMATGQPRGDVLRHEGTVAAVAVSPDGRTVLTGSHDRTARLWDAATGQPRGQPWPHPDEVVAVAFTPDGSRCFTAARDTGVRLWDSATHQPVGKPLTLERAVTSMAVSPSGQTLLLGSNDGMAQLFDLATGLPLGNSFSHGRAVRAVAFSPDGRTALTMGQDAMARLWEVPVPIEGDLDRILLWAQVCTGLELKGDGMVSVLEAPTWQQRRQRLRSLGAPGR
jgi:WD40 repeat protein